MRNPANVEMPVKKRLTGKDFELFQVDAFLLVLKNTARNLTGFESL
jgi:hypothetical protein